LGLVFNPGYHARIGRIEVKAGRQVVADKTVIESVKKGGLSGMAAADAADADLRQGNGSPRLGAGRRGGTRPGVTAGPSRGHRSRDSRLRPAFHAAGALAGVADRNGVNGFAVRVRAPHPDLAFFVLCGLTAFRSAGQRATGMGH
jgi:hypothetical protein